MLLPRMARRRGSLLALALAAAIQAAVAAPARPLVRAPPGATLLYPAAARAPADDEFAAPLVGGVAPSNGHVVRRSDDYAAPIIGGVHPKDGHIVRSSQHGTPVGGDAPAVGFVARQIVDTKIYNESNFPAPNKEFNLSVTREWYAPGASTPALRGCPLVVAAC